jgi:putative ATP-binding cassette transporter
MIVSAIPQLFKVNASIETLYNLEEQLDRASGPEEQAPARKIGAFESVRFKDVVFHYRDLEGTPLFTLGPVNLTLRSGEILFIVGGNGSGKTTLLKLLTGLYAPDSGQIRIDGKPLTRPSYPAYREMISAIFSDFHLFERLYGMDDLDEEKANELLERMDIHTKTEIKDKQFSKINLSTGQKKRIAMVVALLEDRPIYAFDEWAADQDPEFKDYFYEVLLKDLKQKGKTSIVISHDDRYFDHADRLLKMEFGQFVNDERETTETHG